MDRRITAATAAPGSTWIARAASWAAALDGMLAALEDAGHAGRPVLTNLLDNARRHTRPAAASP